MGKRLSGRDVNLKLGDLLVITESITLTIEDGTTVTKSQGVPDGYCQGEYSASGELELDNVNLDLVLEAAKSAGSFTALEPFDLVMNAEGTSDKINIEAFGCKLRIADLMNAQSTGGEKLKYKLSFDVTSRNFVRINGIPYIDNDETENLT